MKNIILDILNNDAVLAELVVKYFDKIHVHKAFTCCVKIESVEEKNQFYRHSTLCGFVEDDVRMQTFENKPTYFEYCEDRQILANEEIPTYLGVNKTIIDVTSFFEYIHDSNFQ